MSVIIFPGQGSQYSQMSKDFYDNFHIVRDTFNLIEDSVNLKIKDIIFNEDPSMLNQTQFTQLAIFTASISMYNVVKSQIDENKLNTKCFLGHSLGEYTALAASGIINIVDCAKILKIRGELMQNAFEPNKSGMAAIIGINCVSAENIIKNNNLDVQIANDNSPNQIVISGKINEITKSESFFKNNGAKKFVLLNVSAAFHSNLMLNAEAALNKNIQQIKFKSSKFSVISNYDAGISNDSNDIGKKLMQQMSNRVRWVESISLLDKLKMHKVIEIGPGKVLTGLIRRISGSFDLRNIEYTKDLESLINEY